MLIYVELRETTAIPGKNHTDQSKDRSGDNISVWRTVLFKHIIKGIYLFTSTAIFMSNPSIFQFFI